MAWMHTPGTPQSVGCCSDWHCSGPSGQLDPSCRPHSRGKERCSGSPCQTTGHVGADRLEEQLQLPPIHPSSCGGGPAAWTAKALSCSPSKVP